MRVSKIGWTDFSGGDLNFVTGCTPVSEGCQHCYARAIYKRFGRDHSVVTWHAGKLDRLCRTSFPEWSPKRGKPYRPMAFVCDTGDLFHESVSRYSIDWAFGVMKLRRDVVWQVLTKRPARMRDYLAESHRYGGFLTPNIWLGVTAENQARADERIPLLLDTPAAVRFVSVEPMLGPVDMARIPGFNALTPDNLEKLCHFWVICGAESGPNRRWFDVSWAESLRKQCLAAGVPFFGKQDSAQRPAAPLVFADGLEHKAWPGVV